MWSPISPTVYYARVFLLFFVVRATARACLQCRHPNKLDSSLFHITLMELLVILFRTTYIALTLQCWRVLFDAGCELDTFQPNRQFKHIHNQFRAEYYKIPENSSKYIQHPHNGSSANGSGHKWCVRSAGGEPFRAEIFWGGNSLNWYRRLSVSTQ